MFHNRCNEKHFRRRHEILDEFFGRGAEGFGRERLRGRFFDNGDLRFVILKLLARKPGSGYDLIKSIEEMSGGAYVPSPGVIYPTLTMLEEQGHIARISDQGGKNTYTLTDAGHTALKQNEHAVKSLFERMTDAGRIHGRHRPPQIMRALGNLKMTLKMLATRNHLSNEQIEKIAAILDRAVREIEQV
jgi:DNA-binding PadR family transcriptional regulator